MDPLSLAASVITVASLAASTCSTISELRSLCKGLPGRLHAVSNEVADLELVLMEVATLLRERAALLGSQQSMGAIRYLLIQAKTKLKELDAVLDRLTAASVNYKVPLVGASIWRKEQGRLQMLQDDIRTFKSSLNILLGASNSSGPPRFIVEVSVITVRSVKQSTQEQLALGEIFMNTMAKIDERVARVEELIHAQSEQLCARQLSQVGPSYRVPAPSGKQIPTPKHKENAISSRAGDSIGLRVRPYVTTCHPGYPCSCHTPHRSATPAALNGILGRLFIGYSGLPVISPNAMTMNAGELERSNYAQAGNISGLQYLFRHGLASPGDVSSSREYTLLRWSLYAKQYEAVEFLVRAGADPDYRPVAALDNSPHIKACHFLLEGGLSEKAINALRTITKGSNYLDDFIDGFKFTKTHKIVLGLSLQNLEEELLLNPDDINLQDAMGRTPLAWAAARGDAQAVATLLSHGADPNIMGIQISGPLSNAAAQGHTTCVELLLEAGADPDPPLPEGIKKGTPLSVASRNSQDATLLKRLLDFGANVNTLTAEHHTPLFHATKNGNTNFAILLLEHGANINALSTTGETPLTTAIKCNSHNTLRLYLDRWSEYTVCPRLKGPNLLEVAALYGDCETLAILASADHLRSKHDQHYALADFKTLLPQRVDAMEELIKAFDELLTVINMAPDPMKGEEGQLESGFLSRLVSRSHTLEDVYVGQNVVDDEDLDGNFQDAVEKLEVAMA
ncbi:hypothetical protein DL762_001959 [Monosporascus cannonballus]|uniref:Fungal N-terminal domain-containing protein n=1 Tax=Monosporascus cannonballus TaxID=155416 RepID=A0ABY0HEY4_9PEZI|nr:hypothetical protein DL762_001959 [Monosporascus cannonballus]